MKERRAPSPAACAIARAANIFRLGRAQSWLVCQFGRPIVFVRLSESLARSGCRFEMQASGETDKRTDGQARHRAREREKEGARKRREATPETTTTTRGANEHIGSTPFSCAFVTACVLPFL